MAISKSGARRIVVDGVPYLWRVRPRPTYGQDVFGHALTVAVQRADLPGRVLVVRTPYVRPDAYVGMRRGVVCPSDLAAYIRRALLAGWGPTDPGGPVYFNAQRDD